MLTVELRPGEQLDDLVINNWKIIQPQTGFRFSFDAVALAHFATVKKHTVAADLGTGTGVIAMLLCARGAARVEAVELAPEMADLARRNGVLNELQAKMTVHHGDMRHIRGVLPSGIFDLVVSNPPYRQVGGGFLNASGQAAVARHELTATLDDVLAAARYLVKYRGRFAMVHLPERLTDIQAGMRHYGLEPKRLRMVHPVLQKKPNMILIEGIRGAKAGLEVLPPLAIYDSTGAYDPEILAWYGGGTA